MASLPIFAFATFSAVNPTPSLFLQILGPLDLLIRHLFELRPKRIQRHLEHVEFRTPQFLLLLCKFRPLGLCQATLETRFNQGRLNLLVLL